MNPCDALVISYKRTNGVIAFHPKAENGLVYTGDERKEGTNEQRSNPFIGVSIQAATATDRFLLSLPRPSLY